MDIVIVGGGPAGLSHAFQLLKINPDLKLTLLEKSPHIGGRTHQIRFHGLLVPGGAGVGRLKKDRKLYKLLRELSLPTHIFTSNPSYHGFTPINVIDIISRLRGIYANTPSHTLAKATFKDFAIHHLGKDTYTAFTTTVGFTDYEHTNIYDVLYNYGFDDTVAGETKFTVPWNDLIATLVACINSYPNATILTNTHIIDVSPTHCHVTLSNNTILKYQSIHLAVPPKAIHSSPPLLQLLSTTPRLVTYIHSIRCHPFIYIYAHIPTSTPINKTFHATFNTMTITHPPLQKIIPYSSSIYMVAYADNEHALTLNSTIHTTHDLERIITATTGIRVHISKFQKIFHECGTHYRPPGTQFLKTSKLLGEAYVLNQGWTNQSLS